MIDGGGCPGVKTHEFGLQHERTSLAWERTAIASIVAGIVLARYSASTVHYIIASLGIIQAVFGGIVLVWAGGRYRRRKEPAMNADVAEVAMVRLVGLVTVVFVGSALVIAMVNSVGYWLAR